MSANNAGAAIGLSNDNKLTVIGELVPNEPDPRAGVSSYIGNDCTDIWWDWNAISEDVGFLVLSCNGSYLQWVTTGSSPVTLGAEGRVTATNGVIVEDAAGDLEAFFAPGTVIPAGTYLWVESGEIPPIEFDSGDPIVIPELTEGAPITPIDISTHFVNGPPVKVFEIFSGSLPPGLAMSTPGLITGTPTTPGVGSAVVFKGTDGRGNSANSNGVVFTVISAALAWQPTGLIGVTLSNGDKTATHGSSGGTYSIIRSATSHASGKWYAEILCVSLARFGTNIPPGYAVSSEASYSNVTNPSPLVYVLRGAIGYSGAATTEVVAGDYVMLAIDIAAQKAWAGRNGVWFNSGDPAAGTNPSHAAMGVGTFRLFSTQNSGSALVSTIRTAAADMASAIPAGFSAWG